MTKTMDSSEESGAASPNGDRGGDVVQTLISEMDEAVFLIDVEETDGGQTFRVRLTNDAHQALTGLSLDAVRGRTVLELLGDEQGAAVVANYRRCVEAGEPIEYEESLSLPGGERRWRTKLIPVAEDGSVTGIVGSAREVTEAREPEREHRRTDRRFQTALEAMSAAVFLKDVDGRYLLMNRACRDAFGVDVDPVGKTDRDILSEAAAARARSDDRRVIEGGEQIDVEETVATPTGERVRLTRKSPVYDEAGEVRGVCGVSIDITEQTERERALEGLKDRLELAVEGAKIGWWEVDLVDETLTWSDEVYRIHGVPVAESVESADGLDFYHPDDRDAVETAFERLRTEGEPYDLEVRTVTAAGRAGWVRAIGDPQFDDAGDVVGALGLFQDITERKEYERTLERQRDALTLLNEVVRHDIRNQLMVVESYTELLEDSLVDDRGRTYARTVIAAARQASDITETAREVTEVLLQVGTARSRMRLRTELGDQIAGLRENRDRVTVAVDGPIPDVTVLADELLRSVFRNLLVNAVVHNDKEAVEIGVSTDVSDETVRVSIADNGPGIADKHKEQIYQEGESGLESGGTGVGLYLVKTLVDRYGGDVWVEDNEPTGSVFVVELPRAD